MKITYTKEKHQADHDDTYYEFFKDGVKFHKAMDMRYESYDATITLITLQSLAEVTEGMTVEQVEL